MKIPQLRILATSFCGCECLYCRPTGEGCAETGNENYIDVEMAMKICRLYCKKGGKEIKITGGDPIFWPELVTFVRRIKSELGLIKVEIITRSPKITRIVHQLVQAGMDVLNFSLDTIDPKTYEMITGRADLNELLSAITYCAALVPVKINAVIMKNINYSQIDELISFCEDSKIHQLKLLDIIDDLQDGDAGNSLRLKEFGVARLRDLYVSLAPICKKMEVSALSSNIVYQGGLGHPMNEYITQSGLVVTVKNSENGAWYGSICSMCGFYPCHDALMALRLTTEGSLQYCLLNEKQMVHLDGLSDIQIEKQFDKVLEVYEGASFMGK